MTTATTFSRQNDAASRASTTYYWENLVLVVVLVLESKGLWYEFSFTLRKSYEGKLANAQMGLNLLSLRDDQNQISPFNMDDL